MKNTIIAATLLAASCLLTGCLTGKVSTITPASTNSLGIITGPVTNTVTIVNTNNLLLETAVLQSATAIGVGVAVQKDPSIVQALTDAQIALDGILNGASTNTPAQVAALLGNNSNPTIQGEIMPLITMASVLEQQLLAKYGTTVGGQISMAILRALDRGLAAGLIGAPMPAVKAATAVKAIK